MHVRVSWAWRRSRWMKSAENVLVMRLLMPAWRGSEPRCATPRACLSR